MSFQLPAVHTWCIVQYGKTLYPGQVEDTDEDDLLVRVLHPIGTNKFIEPSMGPDVLWYSLEKVILPHIADPVKPRPRSRFYQLSPADWQQVAHYQM